MMARAKPAAARLIRFVVQVSALSLLALPAGAEDTGIGQPQEDANGCLERFVQHVRWPDQRESQQPWKVCVAGDAAATARCFEDTRAQGREIVVQEIAMNRPDGAAEVSGCHLLDLRQVDAANQQGWLDAARGRPVLTIGHGPAFCTRGGHICFAREGGRPPFEINLSATQASGLRINARLLAREPDGTTP